MDKEQDVILLGGIPYKRQNLRPISEAKSLDFRGVPAALARAAKRAEDIARQTNTYLVVQRNGQLLKLKVNEL
jgi:hypothetical protein